MLLQGKYFETEPDLSQTQEKEDEKKKLRV